MLPKFLKCNRMWFDVVYTFHICVFVSIFFFFFVFRTFYVRTLWCYGVWDGTVTYIHHGSTLRV